MRFRTRLRINLGVLTLIISWAFGAALTLLAYKGEDAVYESILLESKQLLNPIETNCPCQVGIIRVTDVLTPNMEQLADGVHEVDSTHILLTHINTKRWVYILSSNHGPLDSGGESYIFFGLIILIGFGLAIAFIASFRIADDLSDSLEALVVQLLDQRNRGQNGAQSSQPTRYVKDLFAGVLKRIDEFVLREQRFTRTISHELRTPLSIVSANIELLQVLEPNNENMIRLTGRMKQATTDIERIVEICLFLSREQELEEHKQRTDLVSLLKEKMRTSDIFTGPDELIIVTVPALLRILINNICGNAIEHGHGPIYILVTNDELAIHNRVKVNDEKQCTNGYGFGNTIVQKYLSDSRFGSNHTPDEISLLSSNQTSKRN